MGDTCPEAQLMFRGLGSNFVTPDVIEFGWFNKERKIAYEYSSGKFMDLYVYGVTLNPQFEDAVKFNMSFSNTDKEKVRLQSRAYISQLTTLLKGE
jgi:hypothetical protein